MITKQANRYQHQLEAAAKVIQNGGVGGLHHDVGCGKTITVFDVFEYLKRREPDLRLLVVAPLNILEAQGWGDKIKDWTDWNYYNCHALEARYQRDSKDIDIYLINYASLIGKKHSERLLRLLERFEFLGVLDECFTGDTLVDTSVGPKPISEIKVGERVINCLGLSRVKKSFRRKIPVGRKLVIIKLGQKRIVCSDNHPFFTLNGWIKAKNLKKGDQVVTTVYAMRLVRERTKSGATSPTYEENQEKAGREDFLRNQLCREMENVRSTNTSEDIHASACNKIVRCHQESIYEESNACGTIQTKNDCKESNEVGICSEESLSDTASNESQATYSRGKWSQATQTTSNSIRSDEGYEMGESCRDGIHAVARKTSNRIPESLQDRHSLSTEQDRDRSRRTQPSSYITQISRYQENEEAAWVGVACIEVLESTDPRFDAYRDESGQVVLYDLQIEGHPSFSVEGMLVHNSHRIKNPKSQRTKVVNGYYKGRKWVRGHREYFKYRMILTGTAAPNNPTEWFSQCLFLSEDIFGRRITNFRSKYFYLERTGWDGEIQTVDVTGNIGDQMKKGYRLKLIPQLQQEFYHRIEQYVHFVKADDAIDLPEEVDEVRPVGMTPEQAKLYRQMERDLVIEFSESDEVTASYALTKLQKLNQLANGFVIDDAGKTHVVGTKKNDELAELVDEMGKRQIIIWSQYVKQIELLLERLGDQAIGLKGHDRNDVMREFASGNKKCLVMNPASGSEGLDLQFASVEIFASLNHSWMDYYQCRGRIRRPGQRNKCLYIHMLSDSTIEEQIYLALKDKEDQQEIAHGFIKRIKSANKNRKVDPKKLQPVGGVQA